MSAVYVFSVWKGTISVPSAFLELNGHVNGMWSAFTKPENPSERKVGPPIAEGTREYLGSLGQTKTTKEDGHADSCKETQTPVQSKSRELIHNACYDCLDQHHLALDNGK